MSGKKVSIRVGAGAGVGEGVYNKFAEIDGQLAANASSLAENTQHSINGKKVLSISAYQRQTPENNDLGRFTRAIADAEAGMVLSLKDESVFQIPSTITISKKVHLIGNDVELQTVTQGMDNVFDILNVDGIIISGIKFNQNLMGRTSIHLVNCTNFLIQNCSFTGYSKQYGYYQTDGGIKLDDCKNGKILFNKWENHGDQYTAATADLNRCITIQGTTSDNVVIMGNTFNKVNQAIVIATGNHIVQGNTFNEVHDNVLYMVGNVASVIFNGNYVDHRFDEALVVDSGKLIATSNHFKNIPNKAISIGTSGTALPIRVIVIGNTFDNSDITEGQFIVWRDPSYVADVVICKNNTFKGSSTYEYFNIGNVNKFIFKDNYINVATVANQRMLYFTGTTLSGVVQGNTFIGTDGTSKTVEINTVNTSPSLLYKDNDVTSCRAVWYGLTVEGHNIQVNVGPYVNQKKKFNQVTCTVMPTLGQFQQGDYVKNETPTIQGTAGSKYVVKGWIRITTGTAHVLNTDWVEDKVLTGT